MVVLDANKQVGGYVVVDSRTAQFKRAFHAALLRCTTPLAMHVASQKQVILSNIHAQTPGVPSDLDMEDLPQSLSIHARVVRDPRTGH